MKRLTVTLVVLIMLLAVSGCSPQGREVVSGEERRERQEREGSVVLSVVEKEPEPELSKPLETADEEFERVERLIRGKGIINEETPIFRAGDIVKIYGATIQLIKTTWNELREEARIDVEFFHHAMESKMARGTNILDQMMQTTVIVDGHRLETTCIGGGEGGGDTYINFSAVAPKMESHQNFLLVTIMVPAGIDPKYRDYIYSQVAFIVTREDIVYE